MTVAALVLGSVLAATPPASFDDVARRAAQARNGERPEEAAELYRQGVALRPEWDEGLWYLATLAYEAGRDAEAREAFGRFLGLKPDAGAAWLLRGLCNFRMADYDRATLDLEKGLSLGGANPEIVRAGRYHQALLLVRAGRFELAVEPLTRLARDEPESGGLADAIGLMMLRRPQLPADVPAPGRDLVRRAGHAGYLHLARRGDEAARAFEEALTAFPDEPWLHYAYGVAMLAGDADKGLSALRRAAELQPDAAYPHLEMAFELLKRGDHEGAKRAAERAVAAAPELFAGHNALGRALVELGELERGIGELETAVKLAPDSPEVHYSLASAYARAGRKDDADRERALFTDLERRRRPRSGTAP